MRTADGYADLLGDVFGEQAGIGSRSAVGMGSLPNNIAVEVELMVEIDEAAPRREPAVVSATPEQNVAELALELPQCMTFL